MEDTTIATEQQSQDPSQAIFQQAEERAAALTTEKKKTVIPFVLQGDNENDFVVGYFYEADGITDAKLMGAKLSGPEVSVPKALQALESLLLFEESDSRCRQKRYMNGAALMLLSTIEIASPVFKKK